MFIHIFLTSFLQIHASTGPWKKVESLGTPGLCLLWPFLCFRRTQWFLAKKGDKHVPKYLAEGNDKMRFGPPCVLCFTHFKPYHCFCKFHCMKRDAVHAYFGSQ